MTKLEKLNENYQRALEAHRIKYPVLHPADQARQWHTCGLCGGSVNRADLSDHMLKHEITPETGLLYQLTESFRTVNGRIQKGAKFIKLLWIISTKQTNEYPFGRSVLLTSSATNLPDWHSLQDLNGVKVRWSAKKRKFFRSLWIIIILILVS